MSEIRPRIFGSEIEWQLLFRRHDEQTASTLTSRHIAAVLDVLRRDINLGTNGMLANGGRAYNDANTVEYATGEEDSIEGLLASELAGEERVNRAAAVAVETGSTLADYRLGKRVDYNGFDTSSYHLNLSADASRVELTPDSLYHLGLWAATASLYTGAGKVIQPEADDGHGLAAFYSIGQKTAIVTDGIDRHTSTRKPLVSLRKEPHSGDQWRRIQVVGLDPNLSPWATRMMAGTASLCLRAIEQQIHPRIGRLNSARQFQVLAQLARDTARLGTHALAHTEDGTSIGSLDAQYELLEMAAKTEHTDEEAWALNEWQHVLPELQQASGTRYENIGWVQRQRLLETFMSQHSLDIDSPEVLRYDITLDEIGKHGALYGLRDTIWAEDMPSIDLVNHRYDHPCPTTRASLRVALARQDGIKVRSVNWDKLVISEATSPTSSTVSTIVMPDPFEPHI